MNTPWRAAALASLASLGIAASAAADVRYAEPNGDGDAGVCAQSDPCDLRDAAEDPGAQDGDEVVVLPGTHDLSGGLALLITAAIDVHGAPGARPTITSDHNFGIVDVSADGARLADLELAQNATDPEFGLIVDGSSVIERLVVRSPAEQGACYVTGYAEVTVIRDSVCFNDAGEGPGIFAEPALAPDPAANVALRNVTAISNGPQPGIFGTTRSNTSLNLDVLNSIASAGSGADDVVADEESGTDAPPSIVLRNSNYDTASVPPGETGSVTTPGTGTNQTAPPLLTNMEGAFAQLAGSPTIDAGAADPLLGSLDILGEPRIQGPAPDIGADETANPPDTTPPDFRAKAKRKQKGPNVKVKVRCENEPCAVALRGKLASRDAGKKKLKTARADLAAGERKTLKLKPKGASQVKELLADGATFKATIKAKATDAAGNTAKDKLKVTLAR